jgi:DNA transformation protein
MVDTNGWVAHCLELLSALGTPRARRMFGGHGLYVDDLFIALLFNEVLYLKADDLTRSSFESAGCQPFVYAMKDGSQASLGYWSAPDDAMESPGLMLPWARMAMASALRAAAAKRPAAARKPRAKAVKTKAAAVRRKPSAA